MARKQDAIQLLEMAMAVLVTSDTRLEHRLTEAYVRHIQSINTGDVPAELSAKLQSIHIRMGGNKRPWNEIHVGSYVAAMTPAARKKLAFDIYKLSCELAEGLYH